jgi:hypothetical protein
MSLVNPNIAMSFRMPEFQAPNALAQYAQIQQIQGGRQAQELNALQIQEYQRAREEEEGTRNFLRGRKLADPETQAGLAQFGKTGLGYAKLLQEQQSAALNAKNVQSQIDEREFGTQDKKLKFAWNAVGSASTPQAAIAELTKGVKDGVFNMQSVTPDIQRLQNMTPDEYRQYRVEKVMGILDAKDKLGFMLPKTRDRDTGGVIQVIQDNPALPGYGVPIAGAAVTKTPTIAERTAQGQLGVSQGQLSLAQQRLAQDAQGVTYQQDAQGNLMALPSRLPAGGAPVARPVTGESGAPIKGKGSKELAVSEQQASYNLGRILDAAKEIDAAVKKDPGALKPGVGEAAAASVGLSGTANVARNAQRQIVYGAQRDALDAMLYLATGAAYNKEQLEGQMAAYVPAFTDKPDAVEAKRTRMLGLIQNAKVRAGKAWTPEMDAASQVLFQPIVSGGKPAAGGATGNWSVVR